MLMLTSSDSNYINEKYKIGLNNIVSILSGDRKELDTYRILLKMMNHGNFSMDKKLILSSNFDYLDFSTISSGAQVMYGVACCRHTSAFVRDVLHLLKYDVSLLRVFVDSMGDWHLKRSSGGCFNHEIVLLNSSGNRYLLDSRNNFLLKWYITGDLEELSNNVSEDVTELLEYTDDNISEVGKVLKKYYTLRDLGVDTIYDYGY